MQYLIEFREIQPEWDPNMFKKLLSVVATAIVIVASFAIPSTAATSSSLNNWYTLTWDNKPSLYVVDQTTGDLTLISTAQVDTATGYAGPAGFDVDSTNNVGYFLPFSWDPSNVSALWKIDLRDGTYSQVGPTNATRVTALDMGIRGDIWIAADLLDGQGQGFGKIDTSTGVATFLSPGPGRLSALATSADGVLYAFGYDRNVYTVNTSTMAFTQVGSTNSMVTAADFATSGKIILQTWGGELSTYDLQSNVETSLFTMLHSGTGINGEAFGIGGPTDGRTLNQAIAGAPVPGQVTATPTPSTSNSVSASPAATVVPTLAKTGVGLSNWQTAAFLLIIGVVLTFISTRPRNFE